jgi:hypothetical protein
MDLDGLLPSLSPEALEAACLGLAGGLKNDMWL